MESRFGFTDLPDEMIDEILARTDVPSMVRALGTSASFRQQHMQPEHLKRIKEYRVADQAMELAMRTVSDSSSNSLLEIINSNNMLLKNYIPSLPLDPQPSPGQKAYPVYSPGVLYFWLLLYAFLNDLYVPGSNDEIIQVDDTISKLSNFKIGTQERIEDLVAEISDCQRNSSTYQTYPYHIKQKLQEELAYILSMFRVLLNIFKRAKHTGNKEEYDSYLDVFSSPLK